MTTEKTPKTAKKTTKTNTTVAKKQPTTKQNIIKTATKKIEQTKISNNTPTARGARKSSVATVFLWANESEASFLIVNEKELSQYFFDNKKLIDKVFKPFKVIGQNSAKFNIKIKVHGGGSNGQAEAIAHGISVALSRLDSSYKSLLREHNLLTRDSRAVESKTTGYTKSRRKPQFSKR